MQQLIVNMISNLRKKVEEEVPEKGVFEKVYETIENINPNWSLSHIRLMVRPSFSSTDENDWKRYVEINVFNMPDNPYMCEQGMYYGNKQDIITYLDDPALAQKILDLLPRLESDLNDI